MKIEEFERSGRGNRMRYARPVGDEHELVIVGSKGDPEGVQGRRLRRSD